MDATGPTAAGDATDVPRQIGPYKILEKLGEGGMGIVYLAEQTEPVKRRVALKLIKLGMDTRQVLARFEAERQALAIMSHPNVAKVLDAGATENGRPFFVMEYVPGVPITEYCDLKCLPFPKRLELFTQVCEAIQHAHQKGIIHRDIKPSNVLVASEEGKPQLKVIDFGVAKATSQKLTERTLFTQQGILIGTPEYMSPEQAGTTALDVDTRTDIYSLGVLLYELLVGALPFDPRTLRQAAAVEMLRIIREEDPPKPTTKFGSLGDTADEVARQRHTDVRSLVRQLRGELEWITMRALEKDPARRYSSASELASDVRRHLDDEPVVASPPSRWYRVKKFARKNRGPVAAAAALLAVLAAATVVTTAMYFRSEAARERATLEARRNHLDSLAMQAALNDDVAAYIERSREALELHREMLTPNDPTYVAYLVNRWATLNWMWWDSDYETPGFVALLEDMRQEALDSLRQMLQKGDDPRLLELLEIAGDALLEEEQHVWVHREEIRLMRRLTPEDPKMIEKLNHLSDLLEAESRALRAAGNMAEADPREAEAIDLRREALTLTRIPKEVATTKERLASLLERRGDRLLAAGSAAAAEPLLRESLALLRDAATPLSRRIAGVEIRLGRCLVALERFAEAEPILLRSRRALEGELEGKSASLQMATGALVELYQRWGKTQEASRYGRLLAGPTIASFRELGPLQFGSSVHGRLGGYSIRLANRSLWIFGTTSAELGCEAGRHQCTGTWSWTEDLGAEDGIGGFQHGTAEARVLAEALPLTEEESAYDTAHASEDCFEKCGSAYVLHPGAVAYDQVRDRALVFYHRGIDLDPPWAYTRQGTSIAIWTDPARKPARPLTADGRADLFSADEPQWGSAAVVDGEELYAYACEGRGESVPCLVARVPLSDVMDRTAWRFYAGADSWSRHWEAAKPVMSAAEDMTVHWNEHLGRYLAIHIVPHERSFALRTAERPQGPWSDERVYVVGVAPPPGKHWQHNETALGHPEFAREGGRIEYVTYHRPTGAFWTGETRLVEITFE
jgi:serine/threonine protein kinase